MQDWPTRTAVLEQTDYWQFSGRVAVKANNDGFNGKLVWSQRADNFSTTVSGPLGVGTVRIEGDRDEVTLIDGDGRKTTLKDAETDLYQRYGWTIPVTSLRYWALGIPDPAMPAETVVGDDGLLQELVQGGWTVTIGQYRDSAGQPMPRRVTAENAETRVRLVIDRWLFF